MTSKVILCIAIVAFTSFCGYLCAKPYRKRKEFFIQFKEFNDRFINEISYLKRPIEVFLFQYRYKGEFKLFLEDYFKSIKNNDCDVKETLANSEYSFLKRDEKDFILGYFSMLGKGDSLSQKNYYNASKELISKLQINTEMDYKKRGEIYIKLGFLFGILILILII